MSDSTIESCWISKPGHQEKTIRNQTIQREHRMIPKPKQRHLEEISSIKSIFCEDRCAEFSEGHLDIECIFYLRPILPSPEMQVSYVYDHQPNPIDFDSISIHHLPPIHFYLKLSSSYPSIKPPDYTLDIVWLPPWESSKICQKLDEIWEENVGSEIIFLWIQFLKNQLFEFLNIRDKMDISYLYTFYKYRDDPFYSQLLRYRDLRVSRPFSRFNRCPIQFLEEYDETQCALRFEKSLHFCGICLEFKKGFQSFVLKNCKDSFCRNCLEKYFSSKVNQGCVNSIPCPDNNCKKKIEFQEIQEILNEEMFSKFETLLLTKTLNTMKDAVPCPRTLCQYPVIRENMEDNLATCVNCRYSFCVYCRKGYHGVAPCEMSKDKVSNLINEYQNSSKQERKLLEEKYGKKQIQIVVERHLSDKYLKENAKPCPNCFSQTTKIEGCNKMTCAYCESHFCWLCGQLITLKDPYQHFQQLLQNEETACSGKLFDGVVPTDYLVEDIDIEANLQFFQMQDQNN